MAAPKAAYRGTPPEGFGDGLEDCMTAYSSDDDDTRRLLQLSEEVSRIAAALANMSLGLAAARPADVDGRDDQGAAISVRTVDQAFYARKARARYFPEELFAEPAWDMLLYLYRCELRGRRPSTSDLCVASGVPETTALRWISTLAQKGLVAREPDGREGDESFVTLAPNGSAALRRYFAEVAEGA